MLFQIYRQSCAGALVVFIFCLPSTSLFADTHEFGGSAEKLVAIFPKAKKFVQRAPMLTPDKIASIEKTFGSELRSADQKPVFYITISAEKKPLGVVLFTGVEGPRGLIKGAVGLNMKGEVVKVVVYEHQETAAIAAAEFLDQFVGLGIGAAFKVGEDIDAVAGYTDASDAVALIPKKTLIMSYSLFSKNRLGPKPAPEPELPEEDIPEVDDLKALMALMIDDYFLVVDYFDEKESRENAIGAAKRLVKYGKIISDFEPPKNPDQTEEYVYLQDTFSEKLLQFAEALEKDGTSPETREQWDAIVTLVNQAHLRFSEEEIDLDAY